MILFLLILFTFLLCEYYCYKTCITPFFVIGIVYFFSVPFVNFIGPKLGYYKINDFSILLYTLYLSLIFFSNILSKIRVHQCRYNDRSNTIFIRQQKIIWYAFCLFLFGYFLSFLQAVKIYGLSNIKGKSNGIFGHMGLACVSVSPLIVLLVYEVKKIKYFIGISSFYIIMLLFGGKSYIFISIITSAILLNNQHKMTIKKLIQLGTFLASIAVIIFVTIYALIPCIKTENMDILAIYTCVKESLQHLFYYYSAPFLSSNTYFIMPIKEGILTGLRIMFAPIVSLYECILGNKEYPNIIMKEWASISESAHSTITNVGGLFSESVFHIGYFYSFIYICIICLYANTIYYISRRTNCFRASASLAIALLGLCFFSNYFTLLSVLEIIVYLILFEGILFLLEKRKVYIKDWRFKKTWKNVKL